MADNEETFKLLIQSEGADILPKLQAQFQANNEAMGQLVAAYGRGELSEKAFGDQSKALADTHRNLGKAIKDVEDASGTGASKMAGFGQSALQTGRIVQDFAQGGIGGILNNIEGLTMALGLGSGLAGVLTIVGVALVTLKPQIMAFWEALSGGDSKQILSAFDTLSARIKELKDQPLKLAVDRAELDAAEKQLGRIKEGQAEFEARQKKQTVGQAESGKLVDEALTAAGPEFEDKLKRKYIEDNVANSGPLAEARRKQAEADAEIRAAQDAKKDATTPEDLIGASGALKIAQQKRDAATNEARDIRDAIEANATGQIGKVTKTAVAGNDSADYNQAAAQKQLAKMLRDTGQDKLAAQIERANPGRLAEIDALNRQGAQEEAAGKIAADAAKARDDAEEKAEKKAAAVSFKPRTLKGEAGTFAVGPGQAPKGKVDSDADRRAAKLQNRANQIEDRSPAISQALTGVPVQFSPEQAQHAAQRSMALQAKGLDANRATVQAMGEMMATMAGFGAKIEHLEQQIEGVRGNNRQLNRRAHSRMPTALNSGGPM